MGLSTCRINTSIDPISGKITLGRRGIIISVYIHTLKKIVMPGTLIDSVRSVFTDELLSKYSVLLGEDERNTHKAVHAAIAMVLTDIAYKANFPEGISKVGTLARQAAESDLFGHLHELSTGTGGLVAGSALLNKGSELENALFAPRTASINTEISRYSGVSLPSAAFLAGLASFAALDAVGRHIAKTSVDPNGLALWLRTQTEDMVHAIPVGLQVKPALGIQYYPWERKVKPRRNTALYVVLILLILAAVGFYLYRQHQQADNGTASSTIDHRAFHTMPVHSHSDRS